MEQNNYTQSSEKKKVNKKNKKDLEEASKLTAYF